MLRNLQALFRNLSTENKDEALEEVAQRVVREGMGTAAILFLESSKPMGFLAGQFAIATTPILGGFINPMRLESYADLLGDRVFVERLIRRIEELEVEQAGAEEHQVESDHLSE